MKFVLTYQQEVKIECKNKTIAAELMQGHIPVIDAGGAGVEIGCFSLKNGNFKIVNIKKVK